MSAAAASVLDVMTDARLFGRWFRGPSWRAWRLCAAALFGLTGGLESDDAQFVASSMGPGAAVRCGKSTIKRIRTGEDIDEIRQKLQALWDEQLSNV
jgi:hypothetical protein